MFKSNDSIKFYLFHILVVSILLYSWAKVAFSSISFAENHEVMSILEDLKFTYYVGSIVNRFYDPLLTFTVPPLSLIIYYCLVKKRYFYVHLSLCVLLGLILCEMEWYMIKEPKGNFIFFFSYLRLLEYSLRVAMVFVFQGVIIYQTKKALQY